MKEFLRVFNKRTWFLLLLLCFINVGILILCADTEKEITITGEELNSYLQDYPGFLDRTISNSKHMAMLNVYQSGFSRTHLEKVSECYAALDGLRVEAGDNRGLVLLIQYSLTDIFQIIFLFTIVMSFFAERKKGLVYIVRSTISGRGVLFLQRFAILGISALLGMFCLYGTSILGVHFTFGLDGLERSLQSLPEFMKCPYNLTIGEYLLYSYLIKFAGSFLAGILLYVTLGIFSQFTSYALCILLILEQVGTALLIEPISSLKALRYINLYTLLQADSYFKECIFFNFFGKAVSGLYLTLIITVILLLVLALLGFIIHGKMYVTNKRALEKLAERINRIKERLARQRTLMGWEIYKLGMKQGAILLFLALFILQFRLAFQYDYYYPVDAMERLYFIEYHGELTEETLAEAEWEMDFLKKEEIRLRASLEKLAAQGNYSDYFYNQTLLKLDSNLDSQKGMEPLLDNLQDGMEYTKKTGNTIHIIQPYSYDLLINRDLQTRHRASFLVLIAIVGSIAGIYAYEQQNHMNQLIRSSYRGRLVATLGKPVITALFCGIITAGMHMVQLIHVGKLLGFNDLNVPIQSLPFMREFPIYTSILGYLILLFLIRMAIATAFGLIVALISRKCADKFTAMGLSAFLCMVLLSLSALLPKLQFLNPIYLLSADFFR